MENREHPLRRAYGLEILLGLALIALALWGLASARGDRAPRGGEPPPAAGR